MAISINGRKQNRKMIDFCILLVLKSSIPKSMIIKTKLFEVEEDIFLGKGTFGSFFKGKYKGVNVCLQYFNGKHFVRSNLINEVKIMLNLVSHSSLPLLLGVCLEPDRTLIAQFISFNQESVTLDSFNFQLNLHQ